MNQDLIAVLKANMGVPLSPEIAADILLAADQLPTLVSPSVLKRILPEQFGKFAFSRESIEGSLEKMKLLHRAHWQETEAHRHGWRLVRTMTYSCAMSGQGGTFFSLYGKVKGWWVIARCIWI
jgi:hypothetical protein